MKHDECPICRKTESYYWQKKGEIPIKLISLMCPGCQKSIIYRLRRTHEFCKNQKVITMYRKLPNLTPEEWELEELERLAEYLNSVAYKMIRLGRSVNSLESKWAHRPELDQTVT